MWQSNFHFFLHSYNAVRNVYAKLEKSSAVRDPRADGRRRVMP